MKLAKVGIAQTPEDGGTQSTEHRFSMTQFFGKKARAESEGCNFPNIFVEGLNGMARSSQEAVIFFVQL